MTDARDIVFVKRRLWLPRLCNVCWRFLWFGVAFVRLRSKYQSVVFKECHCECRNALTLAGEIARREKARADDLARRLDILAQGLAGFGLPSPTPADLAAFMQRCYRDHDSEVAEERWIVTARSVLAILCGAPPEREGEGETR